MRNEAPPDFPNVAISTGQGGGQAGFVCLPAQIPGHWQTAAGYSKENRAFPAGRMPFLPPTNMWGGHRSRRQKCPGRRASAGDSQARWGDRQRTTDRPQTGNNRL